MLTVNPQNAAVKESGVNIIRNNYFNSMVRVEVPAQLEGVFIGGVADKIGCFTYIASGGVIKGVQSVGRFCSIANDLSCGYGNHNVRAISTHPMFENKCSNWTANYCKCFNHKDWLDEMSKKSTTMMADKRTPPDWKRCLD